LDVVVIVAPNLAFRSENRACLNSDRQVFLRRFRLGQVRLFRGLNSDRHLSRLELIWIYKIWISDSQNYRRDTVTARKAKPQTGRLWFEIDSRPSEVHHYHSKFLSLLLNRAKKTYGQHSDAIESEGG